MTILLLLFALLLVGVVLHYVPADGNIKMLILGIIAVIVAVMLWNLLGGHIPFPITLTK